MKYGWIGVGVVLAVGIGAAAGGCGGDDPPPVPLVSVVQNTTIVPPCEAGRQVACGCPGGAPAGVQVCVADGSGWGTCQGCLAPTSSSTTGSGGGGGEGGAGGAPCVPKADPCSGLDCGLGDDGCGLQVECPGHCAVGDYCAAGSCCHPTVTCDGHCGPTQDGCGVLACDMTCGDGVWQICGGDGKCACTPAAANDPLYADAVGNCPQGSVPSYCGEANEAAKKDAPVGCAALNFNGKPGALYWCCPG